MSYQVIARKYRPQRFAEVVGQEHVTQTLANAIQHNRIAHAYLFVGPRGTGKTTLARIFAKCLNCTGGPKVDFDDSDPRCQEIAEGRSLDVLEIDGASNRGIEEVRELRETVKYAPATSRFKIYIIDEVHMLTKEAFNALLKTLEEPPAHVKFMFATTEPEKVLPTILSRCQRFDLRRIPTKLIVEHLTRIAALEKVTIDEAALHAVARGAEGGMRDAQSALDQLISFCGAHIVEEDVLSMFGLAARGQIFALSGAILAADAPTAMHELDTLAKKGKDVGRLLGDLLQYFRNLLLFQISRGDLTLLDVSETEVATLTQHSGQIPVDALTRIMDILSESEARLRDAASKRILIEVAVLKAIQAKTAVSINSVLERIQALRAEAAADGSAPPSSKANPVSASAAPTVSSPVLKDSLRTVQPTRAAPSAAPIATPTVSAEAHVAPLSLGRQDLAQLWTGIVDAVGRVSQFVRSYLIEAHVVSLSKNLLTIGFDPEFADHLTLVDNPKNRTLIETKLRELGYPDVAVKFVQAEAPSDWVRPALAVSIPPPEAAPVAAAPPLPSLSPAPAKPVVASKEDFRNDPLIKKALELFKGQIVEVRT